MLGESSRRERERMSAGVYVIPVGLIVAVLFWLFNALTQNGKNEANRQARERAKEYREAAKRAKAIRKREQDKL